MGHRDEVVADASNRPGIALGDKYHKAAGTALLNGSQALVRLLLNQAERDRTCGLNTGGFVSGYRGSPLSGFDQTLWFAGKQLAASGVHFQPAINEDLAATACWGTQQLALFPGEATVDGVFALWYGKGPGVDRSGDALKHGNGAGTSAHGGVLVLAADDHTAKSSTFGHQSEQALVAAFIPVLYPSNVQEYLDLGIHGWAMGRHSGLWVGMKCVSDVVETTSVAEVGAWRVQTVEPAELPADPHIRWPDVWAEQEPRIVRERLPAALAYCRANGINRIEFKTPGARIGIVCAGKAYNDVRQALSLLGLGDTAQAGAAGVALLKLGMVWPLEPAILREFAQGLDELLVVEEKRPLIEQQIKDELYADAVQGRLAVRVSGKTTGATGGEWGAAAGQGLLRSDYELTPIEIAAAIAARLGLDLASDGLAAVRTGMQALAAATRQPPPAVRKPYFCSGCPHNSSTKVPEGSRAMAGIGCHYMANWMDRATETYTHMGAEGVPWIAQSRFSTRRHIFANLGDGTYFHSGSLAIRQAVAARVSMTYKILFNDAVAMTGGQPIEGQLTVDRIAHQVAAEGVGRIAIVSDDTAKYAEAGTVFPPGATVHHRSDLEAVQQELAAYTGVSVLLYDQTCASEKRRRRKRGTYPDPAERVVIHPAVCEGCGDCSVQSNCLSVEPLETELGRKRQINQSSCNKDFACTTGFCPSFVSVKGARLPSESKAPAAGGGSAVLAAIEGWGEPPAPQAMASWAEVTNVLINGVGGTGVVTVGALLGMAAHIEGRTGSVLDMAGLAQKGGAVWSHVRLAAQADALNSSRIVAGQADVLIGCDLVVSAHPDTLSRLQPGRSRGVVNSDATPTADFVRNGDWTLPQDGLQSAIATALPDAVAWLPAQSIAVAIFGDAIFANPVMLGYAWQMGWLPLSIESIRQAVRLNGQQVERNLTALCVGQWAAHDRARLTQALAPAPAVVRFMPQRKLRFEEVVVHRRQHLVAYQGEHYADRYTGFMAQVKSACDSAGGHAAFATEVASQLARLMAYKDEYEVARLHADPAFLASVRTQFEGDLQLEYHLAPPLLARRNAKGELQKRRYGAWVGRAFALLARLRFLRGTPLDPFGHTHERRVERSLPAEYQRAVAAVLPFLATWPGECLELARLPARIRGYGHVKDRTIAPARERMHALVQLITGEALEPAPDSGYGKYLNNPWA